MKCHILILQRSNLFGRLWLQAEHAENARLELKKKRNQKWKAEKSETKPAETILIAQSQEHRLSFQKSISVEKTNFEEEKKERGDSDFDSDFVDEEGGALLCFPVLCFSSFSE